jgi:hypothetical protein
VFICIFLKDKWRGNPLQGFINYDRKVCIQEKAKEKKIS